MIANNEIVLISDARIRGIKVVECGEPLVDMRGTLLVDARRGDAQGYFAHTRESVRIGWWRRTGRCRVGSGC